jgi:carbamoyltransferase
MSTYVLGTHVSHDASACLLKDGRIVAAIEKERLTRIKHDGGNDNEVVKYCLNAEGIKIKDVALVVQNANFDMFEYSGKAYWAGRRIVEEAKRVVTISHHLAHAYSAIGTAPFDEMAVLVVDGCGNSYEDCMDAAGALVPERPPSGELAPLYFEKDSYYAYSNGECRALFKDFSPWGPIKRHSMSPGTTMHSIGGAYLGVSVYVFRGMEDPGKLMGLAPYGRPGVFTHEMFTLRDGRVFLKYDWMKHFADPARTTVDFKNNFQYYADIAYWAQREIERALLYVVRARHALYPTENLAYAGGVALNAVANRLILTETPFRRVYFQPAAADNGVAIGCAFYGWLDVLGNPRVTHDGRSHFGRSYRAREVEDALERFSDRVAPARCSDVVDKAAELLAEGKVIAWFQDGSEFGPRALGHRSILALPVREALKEFINAKVKFREDFRPFAPSVPVEDANTYFDMDYDSPYMILVAPTREHWRKKIPAVVHCDGSARVQTVHKEITPRYYELHAAVKRKTALSVLLNTSFNKRGMPIVETPQEALSLFVETPLDALVIDDWLIVKKAAAIATPRAEPSARPVRVGAGSY